MTSSAQFEIGASVTCRDNTALGRVKRVVADPVARRLTHLVIGPRRGQADDRLVPAALAHVTGSAVVLTCDAAEFADLRSAVETDFVPGSFDDSGYGPEESYLWPNYALTMGGMGTPGFQVNARVFDGCFGLDVKTDRVPPGDVEFRRGCALIATDGTVGQLDGLITDPATARITHLLLREGHLWGRHEIAIPVHCVTRMADDIHLNVTKNDVEKLPAVAHADLVP